MTRKNKKRIVLSGGKNMRNQNPTTTQSRGYRLSNKATLAETMANDQRARGLRLLYALIAQAGAVALEYRNIKAVEVWSMMDSVELFVDSPNGLKSLIGRVKI